MLEVIDLSAPGMRAPVSFRAGPGELVWVRGPSGSGKSRLLRAIADLDPHTGEVVWQGVRQQAMRPWDWRRRLCYVPAESAWWSETPRQAWPTPVDEALLAALGCEAAWLDEPTSHIDPQGRDRIEALL